MLSLIYNQKKVLKRLYICWLWCFIGACWATQTFGQSYQKYFWEDQINFKPIDLNKTSTWDVAIDSKGYLWFSTNSSGLLRYNGVSTNVIDSSRNSFFKNVTTDNYSIIVSDPIGNLFATSRRHKIYKFNSTNQNFLLADTLVYPMNVYMYLESFGQNGIVMSINGKRYVKFGFLVNDSTFVTKPFLPETNMIFATPHPDVNKTLFAGFSSDRNFLVFDTANVLQKTAFMENLFPDYLFYQLYWVKDSLAMAFGKCPKANFSNYNLVFFNPYQANKPIKTVVSQDPTSALNSYFNKKIFWLNDSTLWLFSKGKSIWSIDLNTLDIKDLRPKPFQPNKFSHYDITEIIKDKFGNIWASGAHGASVWNLTNQFITPLSFEWEMLGPVAVNTLKVVGDTALWIDAENYSFRKISLATGQVLCELPTSLKKWDRIYSIEALKNNLLLCTDQGLFLFNESNMSVRVFSEVLKSKVQNTPIVKKVLRTTDNNSWVVLTNLGVFWLDDNGQIIRHLKSDYEDLAKRAKPDPLRLELSSNNVKDALALGTDQYVFSTLHGVSFFDFNKKIQQKVLHREQQNYHSDLVSLTVKKFFDYYWIGTWGQGLMGYKLNAKHDSVISYLAFNPKNSDLPHNVVTNIEQLSDSLLLATTLNGVFVFNPFNPNVNHSIEPKEGIRGLEYHSNAVDKAQNGYVFLGSKTGITVLTPFSKLKGMQPGKVVIDKIEVLSKPKYETNTFETLWFLDSAVVLPFDQNSLRIHYFNENIAMADISYEYKLPQSDKWVVTHDNSIILGNLSPGSHKILIRPADSPFYHIENKEKSITTFIIKITKPWWARWYAVLSFILIGLFIVFVVFSLIWGRFMHNERKLQNEIKLQKESLESQRLVILKQKEVEDKNHLLLIAQKELKRANDEINQVISILSHDLRSPLTTLKGFIGIAPNILAKNQPEENNHLFRKINISVGSSLSLIDNMLFWSRGLENNLSVSKEMVDLHRILLSAIALHELTAEEKNVTVEYFPQKGIWVYADPTMVHIIFRNLISNALKFTPKGGKISINVELLTNKVKIDVVDTGVGMDKDKIKEIFTGTKVESVRGTNSEKGTGLGLVICLKFVRKNNGNFTIKSEIGQGTTATVKLPIRETPSGHIEL